MAWYDDLIPAVDVPEEQSGNWRVERFTVSDQDAKWGRLRALTVHDRNMVASGTYTRLCRDNALVMSDTRQEKLDHIEVVRRASDRVLLNGLGLGMVANACLLKDAVKHVTVVEISQDVVDLVADHYLKKFGTSRLSIVHANAFEWKPSRGERWDVVWHDVWSDICGVNWEGMKRLHRRYAKRAGWQGIWCRDETRKAARFC